MSTEDDDIKSKVINMHDAGIYATADHDRPIPKGRKKNEFLFFSTVSGDLLLNGKMVKLDMQYKPNECKEFLKKQLQYDYPDIKKMDLLIYLAGGIPFLGGTLGDFYNSKSKVLRNVKNYIYGVLTYKFEDDYLNETDYLFHDINDDTNKKLLSPICESSFIGLCDMSCLIAYLGNTTSKREKLLECAAMSIRFPPLITSLCRIINGANITHRDIITVCSTFYTYFNYMIRSVTKPENIFEYALRCCNLIIHIDTDKIEGFINNDDDLSIEEFDDKYNRKDINYKFLDKLNQPDIVYFWKVDTDSDFQFVKLDQFDQKAIDDANKSFASFRPIAPLSIRGVNRCSFVRGKEHNFLYTEQSLIKASTDDVVIFDPTKGKSEPVNLEKFAQSQGNTEIDNVANLIDPEKVEQIIMVCFDRSSSMKYNLEGNESGAEVISRSFIATQYLTSFANKFFAYRIPCILGLITFNQDLEYRCPLSPLIPDFEKKGLEGIEPYGCTAVWDAISDACDKLNEFTKDENGNPIYTKATKRILVISDGEDNRSHIESYEIARKLIENKIILDSVLISHEELCKELAVLAHISGGLALNPKDVYSGIDLFEMSAFQNYNERKKQDTPIIKGDKSTKPAKLTPDKITDDFIKQAINDVEYDEKVINQAFNNAANNQRLATPEHICSIRKTKDFEKKVKKEPTYRRILRELHYASLVMNSELSSYDPDLVIFPTSTNIFTWKAFMRAPVDQNYQGRWFSLLVTFPEEYPVEPPKFRFISIPYHLNVSSEGRICMEMLEKGYIPSFHVVDILQRIKEIFITENIEWPISITILDTFLHNRDEYYKKVAKKAIEKGKAKYDEFITNSSINKEADDYQFTFENETEVPSYMRSQISGRVYRDPVIPPSCGQIYERKELKQLVAQNKNPICVYTGLPITETLEKIDQLKSILNDLK